MPFLYSLIHLLFKSTSYNYIIIGAGCAGLSLLMRMLRSGKFSDKKILLIDKEPKVKNDRTWCFWEQKDGFFEEIVYKKWKNISFLSDDFSSSSDISPYQYKMIRGIDFYRYCFDEISRHTNVEIIYGDVKSRERHDKDEFTTWRIDDAEARLYDATTQIFNSVHKPGNPDKKTMRLLQHFKGWVIETNKPAFNPRIATMMDFRVHQEHGTSFAYILPFNETTALVEYTLFTKELLTPNQYDTELKEYINSHLDISEFTVREEEFGVIPMTNEKFNFRSDGWQIGTAGGQTKASTGFTFQFIQKQSEQIVDCLVAGKSLNDLPRMPARFCFYDNTLLHILYHDTFPGKRIFTRLFQKNKPQQVLRFLDNESSLRDEIKIISSLPTWPFLKAALKQL
jgi:lycopene beta-cyclase